MSKPMFNAAHLGLRLYSVTFLFLLQFLILLGIFRETWSWLHCQDETTVSDMYNCAVFRYIKHESARQWPKKHVILVALVNGLTFSLFFAARCTCSAPPVADCRHLVTPRDARPAVRMTLRGTCDVADVCADVCGRNSTCFGRRPALIRRSGSMDRDVSLASILSKLFIRLRDVNH